MTIILFINSEGFRVFLLVISLFFCEWNIRLIKKIIFFAVLCIRLPHAANNALRQNHRPFGKLLT